MRDCIHDGETFGRTDTDSQGRSDSWCWCRLCNSLLWTSASNPHVGYYNRTVEDDAYRQLYTREGRLNLLRELTGDQAIELPEGKHDKRQFMDRLAAEMRRRNMEVPSCWSISRDGRRSDA